MTIIELTALTQSSQKTTEEKLHILKRVRWELMEELHGRQQLVDQVDYLIFQLQADKKTKNLQGGR
ncbi:MAG: hypothetical protein LUD78_04160 [Clostridiales bacterium]|nr:hypothetical protein [Clostridiales bacterium]